MGAKLAFLFAEGASIWGRPNTLELALAGKSIVGGLLGGYGGVELVKHVHGIKSSTGDHFALILPFSLALGRVGCWSAGCCQGIDVSANCPVAVKNAAGTLVWPAPAVEALFLLMLLPVFLTLQRHRIMENRLFGLFLMSYGTFRFLHEFLRATPKWLDLFSGYQVLCLLMIWLGARYCGLIGLTTVARPSGP